MCLQIEEDVVLFQHRGKNRRSKMKNIESANKIMDRLDELPGVTLRNNKIQMCQMIDSRSNEEMDSSGDESESSDASLEESDDEDSEDGSRSH